MPRIEVDNFGPIGHASVELKPLTVFIGPNNSGKSYLALAIYSLSRTLSDELSLAGFRGFSRSWAHWLEFPPQVVTRMSSALKKAWPRARVFPSEALKIRELPPGVQDALTAAMSSVADSLSKNFGAELLRCYGTELSNLGRRGSDLARNEFSIGLSDDSGEFVWEMRSRQEQLVTTEWETGFSELTIDFKNSMPPWRFLATEPQYFLQGAILQFARLLFRRLASRAHYMPASRSGILLGHKTLASLIVGRSSRAWIEPMEIPRLPGVIIDLIQALLFLAPGERPKGGLDKVVSFLEGQVTRGTVDLDTRVEYPEIFYQNESGQFRLHQVSSMVSEIAPIVLFLKYLVRRGDLFIIEEPESHLDADNQRKLARAIAMLVRADVKVLITTHSDYFVSQINNLLLLSQLTPRRRLAKGYAANEVLDPARVGAYLFRPSDQGSQVELLEVTSSGGIPIDTFTDAHSALYNEAISLEHSQV